MFGLCYSGEIKYSETARLPKDVNTVGWSVQFYTE